MSFYEDDNNKNYNEITESGKSRQTRERGGLIPITANILSQAEVTKDESVEYQGITISDITAIGYIIDYKELESKIKITLFDYTGIMEIYFLNRNDSSDNTGLAKFQFDGKRKAVQIFGTVKVFKNEKNIQGAKIISVWSSYVLYHKLDVIHAWLYLTGKLQELKDNQIHNTTEEAKLIATSRNDNLKNSPVKMNSEEKIIKEAINLLENFNRRQNKNEIGNDEIKTLFKKFGNKKDDIIRKLVEDNKLIETDYGYEIMF